MATMPQIETIENNLLAMLQQMKDFAARAERTEEVEALLADERLRVANLERELSAMRTAHDNEFNRSNRLIEELAARPVVTEEKLRDIESDWNGTAKDFVPVIRRHLLPPAPPEPEPESTCYTAEAHAVRTLSKAFQNDDDYARVWHANIAVAFQDEGGEHAAANRAASRFMKSAFDVEVKDYWTPQPPEPEPIPCGVWYSVLGDSFHGNSVARDVNGYIDFRDKWHARRNEFPQSREEAERRGQSDDNPFIAGTGLMGHTEPGQRVTADNAHFLPPGSVVHLDGSDGILVHLHDDLWYWRNGCEWCYDRLEGQKRRLPGTLFHIPVITKEREAGR